MRNTWLRGLISILLLALFSGNTGLPLLDALAYHQAGRGRLVVHVESEGASCHAERCAVSLAIVAPRYTADPPAATAILENLPVPERHRIAATLVVQTHRTTASSRAPPPPLV